MHDTILDCFGTADSSGVINCHERHQSKSLSDTFSDVSIESSSISINSDPV